jgi:hypothetical protein
MFRIKKNYYSTYLNGKTDQTNALFVCISANNLDIFSKKTGMSEVQIQKSFA